MVVNRLFSFFHTSRALKYFLALVPASILLALQRLLSPAVIIRTAPIDTSRIGWFHNLDWHLKVEKSSRVIELYFKRSSMNAEENKPFLSLWRQHISLSPTSTVYDLTHRVNIRLGAFKYTNPMKLSFWNSSQHQCAAMLEAEPLKFSLNKTQLASAKEEFRTLGVVRPFICFHNRDASYLETVSPGRDWSYHDYRDSSIFNLIPAIEKLVCRGYSCVRMGTHISERSHKEGEENVPLYAATQKQSNLLDLYLSKECSFFITGDTGMNIYPYMFNRPIVFHNWNVLAYLLRNIPYALVLPKMYKSNITGDLLTFDEMINGQLKNVSSSEDLSTLGLTSIENSGDEISDVVEEMSDRINGKWEESEDDVRLQNIFWSKFNDSKQTAKGFKVGTKFLKKYEFLL